MLFSIVCPPSILKLHRAAEISNFANPLAIDQWSLVKSSGRLALPHEEGACLSPSLHTEMNKEEDLLHG